MDEFDYGTMFWSLNQGLRKEHATGLLSDDAKAAVVEAALSAAFPDPNTDKVRARSRAAWNYTYWTGLEQIGVLDVFGPKYQEHIVRALVKHTPKKAVTDGA